MRKEEQLLAYLKSSCPGRQYVARGRKLRDILCISESRLHEMVNHLRQEGHPIGSSQNGYFYAETAGESNVTIQNLRRCRQVWVRQSEVWNTHWTASRRVGEATLPSHLSRG